jgi:hypothetical protein
MMALDHDKPTNKDEWVSAFVIRYRELRPEIGEKYGKTHAISAYKLEELSPAPQTLDVRIGPTSGFLPRAVIEAARANGCKQGTADIAADRGGHTGHKRHPTGLERRPGQDERQLLYGSTGRWRPSADIDWPGFSASKRPLTRPSEATQGHPRPPKADCDG